MSFGKQVYVKEDQVVPESMQIPYDNNNTPWVYLSVGDSSTCFVCQQPDHIAKTCLNRKTSQQANTIEPATETMVNISTQDMVEIPENSNNLKMPPPSTSTTASDDIIR
ncbi:hypothetical protein QAD02_023131 [Eretmocerus hayati]|uniref:Uncharacterized protein n=1 Tax=Eretmocerus hayati TaxID=131215 RepID=A0ACC2PV55_9HYME|nr:hypothetical protein QAD02_023131 [Eretmocerus hayati]